MLKLSISFLQSKGPVHITPTDVQEKYLSLIREFFDKGKVSELLIMQGFIIVWVIFLFCLKLLLVAISRTAFSETVLCGASTYFYREKKQQKKSMQIFFQKER